MVDLSAAGREIETQAWFRIVNWEKLDIIKVQIEE